MQIYNTADTVCSTVRAGMAKDELYRHAQANKTTISILEVNGMSNQAKLGFNYSSDESCGCMVSLTDNRVTKVTDTFCQSQ